VHLYTHLLCFGWLFCLTLNVCEVHRYAIVEKCWVGSMFFILMNSFNLKSSINFCSYFISWQLLAVRFEPGRRFQFTPWCFYTDSSVCQKASATRRLGSGKFNLKIVDDEIYHKYWTLLQVLPPWGPLPHWNSKDIGDQLKLPWKKFFDTESLMKYVSIMELSDLLSG
jgi:hypothetical protein